MQGRVVAITGGARGIGASTARLLAAKGAQVAIGDLDADLAEKTAAELGVHGFGVDVTDAQQFAKFLQKLEATKDVDGKSLLHNSMILYGSGNADGNRHTHSNLPIILAGAGGGTLTPGRFVKHNSVPASNLFLSMADRMGIQGMERFGDSSARLANI